MSSCPVGECTEVSRLRSALKWWGGTIIGILVILSAPALYSWARTLSIPEMKEDIKDHEKRITISETEIKQILKNTEEIKEWIQKYHPINRGD